MCCIGAVDTPDGPDEVPLKVAQLSRTRQRKI